MLYLDFVKEVASKAETSQAVAKSVLSAFVDTVLSTVKSDKVRVPGLGIFRTKTLGARTRKLPNGKTVNVPQHTRLAFRASKGL